MAVMMLLARACGVSAAPAAHKARATTAKSAEVRKPERIDGVVGVDEAHGVPGCFLPKGRERVGFKAANGGRYGLSMSYKPRRPLGGW